MKKSLVLIMFLLLTTSARALPQYASDTGQSCSTCHTDSTIGELTETGKAYSLTHQWPPQTLSSGQKLLIIGAGFVHLLAAMILVGSMFFVHTIHKVSALVLGGVPRNELKMGWISLILMGTTGIYLTLNKFNNLGSLVNSYSGKLVLGKIIIFSILTIFAAFVTLVLNKRLMSIPPESPPDEKVKNEMSLEELHKYDGSDGLVYVAYAGRIFDVTDSRLWKNGLHMRKHRAGSDLTMALTEAPHGPDLVETFQAVARVFQENRPPGTTGAARLFKIMAVINFMSAMLAVFLSALLAWPL